MAIIEDTEAIAYLFQTGIATLAAVAGHKVWEVENEIASVLNVTARTLQNWKNPQNIPQRIEDSQLLGFVWLMLTQGNKDLTWLIEFINATDFVFYNPPSATLVRAHLQKARLNGQAVSQSDIEAMIGRLFGQVEANPRIRRISSEWCTAMPIAVESFASVSGELVYLLLFDGEIKLDTYFVYFDSEYVPPNFLKLEGFDFERTQWKFKISSEWVASRQEWNREALWKVDYFCGA